MFFEKYAMFLSNIVEVMEIILNTIGVFIIIYSVLYGTFMQLKHQESARHHICAGISHALNYNLATEVLKIITNREWKDLLIIGGIFILKFMVTLLFMLELKQEEQQLKMEVIRKSADKDNIIVVKNNSGNFFKRKFEEIKSIFR